MTDICKCKGIGCNKKDTCFRYLATDSEYQSYVIMEDANKCTIYWHVSKEDLEKTQKTWND